MIEKDYKVIFGLVEMLPQFHFFGGLIVSFVLYFGFDVGALGCFVFLVATVGIDVDHYLYYVYRKKDWSLWRAANWLIETGEVMRKMSREVRSEFYNGFWFLHGVEVLVLLGILGYFVWSIFYFVCLGFGFHLILDYIHQVGRRGRFDKFSIVYDYFKYGNLKFVEEIRGLEKLAKDK